MARPALLLNEVSVAYLDTIKRCTPGIMHVSAVFPTTHYHCMDSSFVKMLGVSTARALAVPIAIISMRPYYTFHHHASIYSVIRYMLLYSGVNSVDFDSYATQLNTSDATIPSTTIMSYRTVRRKVAVVHWEVCMTEVRQILKGIALKRM